MADWGMKVSKAGESIDVSTAEKDLLFTTKNNTVKIDPDLSIKRTANGSGAATIVHSFGYKPMFMGFYKSGGNWYPDRYNAFDSTTSSLFSHVVPNGDFRVFIFRDEIV